jgi:hypothetical protein
MALTSSRTWAVIGTDLPVPLRAGRQTSTRGTLRSRVTAYDPELWHDLFVAVAGAAAALAGLVFVAVSINVERILQYKGLPERAWPPSCSSSAR